MKKFHAIAGLPRSGSTLLCDILNQNPRFHAGSTSSLPVAVQKLREVWSQSPEVISDLAHDRTGTEARIDRAIVGLLSSWYEEVDADVVFDKGRLWVALHEIMPLIGGKVICCVRDPRTVMASIEKQREKAPALVWGGEVHQTQLERTHGLLGREGMVGGPLAHIEDLIRRGSPHAVAVIFERLVADPEATVRALYRDLEEPYFDHNFDSVEGTATDLDAQYLYKFPHQREAGPVKDPMTSWTAHVPQSIAEEITKSFPLFCGTFGYA